LHPRRVACQKRDFQLIFAANPLILSTLNGVQPIKQNKRSGQMRRRILADFDQFDLKILSALRRNGRLSMSELAEQVGLTQSPCWTRLKRLEADGAIKGYVAVLDHTVVGVPDIVFVEITLDHHDDSVLEKFGSALARIPEVLEAHLVTGEYDYLVKVAVAGTEHYERFLRESLYRIDGIRNSRSTFALRNLKDAISVDPMEFI
jgi:Lrp/AsnC family leucine-responsive transcriptional regulator